MEASAMPLEDARRSFNLGVGMVLMVDEYKAAEVLADLKAKGEAAWTLGRLVKGTGKVVYR
jgi:phosphoribosylformylglycinamidine cyclo-ligase